jgi:hypothetical protein
MNDYLWAPLSSIEFLPPKEQPLPYLGITPTTRIDDEKLWTRPGYVGLKQDEETILSVRAATESEAIRKWNICVRALEAGKESK